MQTKNFLLNLRNKEGLDSMKKNIQTHEADYKLTQKFLEYANCADASSACL